MGILWAHTGAIGCIELTLGNAHKLMGFYTEVLILGGTL